MKKPQKNTTYLCPRCKT